MLHGGVVTRTILFSSIAIAQAVGASASESVLPPETALPIISTSTGDANRMKVANPVSGEDDPGGKDPGVRFARGNSSARTFRRSGTAPKQ